MAWVNSDDVYLPGVLTRVGILMKQEAAADVGCISRWIGHHEGDRPGGVADPSVECAIGARLETARSAHSTKRVTPLHWGGAECTLEQNWGSGDGWGCCGVCAGHRHDAPK